ncbi:MAG: hypothetical protein AAGA15_06255 [Pseudomonadota bacterium]
MKFTQAFIDQPTVGNDTAITEDVLQHLIEHLPHVVSAYPAGYFIALVRHSVRIARDQFGLNETAAIRLFVRMRWEIAPGFYKHPTIAKVMSDQSLRSIDRFETLLLPQNEHVWLEAMEFDGAAYWRGQHSDGFDDLVIEETET